jgi:hypothetical protein
MEVRYRVVPTGYLHITVSGQWDLEESKQEMEAIRDEANSRGITRLLADVREMSPQESDLTRLHTGEYLARIFRPPFRLAVIDSPEFMNKFVENVAVNRGATFAAFPDEKAALEWLMT